MEHGTDRPLARHEILIAICLTAVVLGVIAKLGLWLSGVPLVEWQWTPQAIVIGVLIGSGIALASQLLYECWPSYRVSADDNLSAIVTPLAWPDLLWLGLLPGLSEEILFRGVILAGVGFTPLGLAVSSAVFGTLHLTRLDRWPYCIWAALIGAVLGGSVIVFDNLLVAIVAHATANILSGCVWKARSLRLT